MFRLNTNPREEDVLRSKNSRIIRSTDFQRVEGLLRRETRGGEIPGSRRPEAAVVEVEIVATGKEVATVHTRALGRAARATHPKQILSFFCSSASTTLPPLSHSATTLLLTVVK